MHNKITISFFIIIAFAITSLAQSSKEESITVPLSDPGKSGLLIIKNHNGRVNVEGYSGSEVQVIITKNRHRNDHSSKYGLKRIPNQSLDVSISEEDNVVRISGRHNKGKDFLIKVPKNFSLSISTHHDGEITVSDVNGEIETKGHHGGITLSNVGGSVVADTHHGAIRVTLNSISHDIPMAFTTYHGDVDITFPSTLNAKVKMKSSKGDIYTDFDMTIQKPQIKKTEMNGKNEIKLSGWTHGTIGSGGKEFMFATYHGDIIIRKE